MFVAHRNCVMQHRQVVMLSIWDHADPEIESHRKQTRSQQQILTLKFCKYGVLTIRNPMYFSQVEELFHIFTENRTHNLCIGRQLVVSLWYQCCFVRPRLWNFVIYREDWLSIKFGENDSFRKLFLFFENTFQYLGGISQDISVSHFDSRRSLSLANRRQIVGDLPRWFFLSALLSLVISMTGRSERSARALRDGADVVREAIGN